MSNEITVYFSSVCSTLDVKKKQKKIRDILGDNYKGAPIKYVDIAGEEENKTKMREIAKNDRAIVPQIAKGDEYIGNFDAFDEAVEMEDLKTFLKI